MSSILVLVSSVTGGMPDPWNPLNCVNKIVEFGLCNSQITHGVYILEEDNLSLAATWKVLLTLLVAMSLRRTF